MPTHAQRRAAKQTGAEKETPRTLYSIQSIAYELDISVRQAWRLVDRFGIDPVRLGGNTRFTNEHLERMAQGDEHAADTAQ